MTDSTRLAQAHALNRAGRLAEARKAYEAMLQSDPEQSELWFELAVLQRRNAEYAQALHSYERALQSGISDAHEVHLNRAVILTDGLQDHAGAERELLAALALKPDYAAARLNLANLREEQGRRDDALAEYRQVLPSEQRGERPGDLACEALARILGLPDADEDRAGDLAAAIAAFESDPERDPAVRANLAFAIARRHEREEDFEAAFGWFEQANACAARTAPAYVPARMEGLVGQLLATPPQSPSADADDAGLQPLFICGMYRSGSTLLERILQSHPAIHAGGELTDLARLAASMRPPFPLGLAELRPATAAQLAERYRERLRALVPAASLGSVRFVSDKRPDNYLLLDLIKALFPTARILHTVRNPLDTGLSIYQQHLSPRSAAYSTDLQSIGHYFGQYRRLMARHRQAYGPDLLDVDYDQLVREPEAEVRRVLDFLGLPWEPECLQFHRQGGVVKTASYWQVREPLHDRSSGRWKAYATPLRTLRASLLAAGIAEQELDRA